MDSQKTSKLFSYVNQTIELMTQGYISQKDGAKILKRIEASFENRQEIYPQIYHMSTEQTKYWVDFLFQKNEDVLNYLEVFSKKNWQNKELLEKVVEKFLKLPVELKKDFYGINFVEHKNDSRNGMPYVSMCERSFVNAKPSTIFHNLPSILVLGSVGDHNAELFEKICKDIKKTLNISQDEFLDTYGTTLVHCLKANYINTHWYDLQMDKRPDMQQAYGLKFYNMNRIFKDSFFAFVDKGLLPYDLKLPRRDFPIMGSIIHAEISDVTNYLRTVPFNAQEFSKRVQSTKDFLNDLSTKHDLYFLDAKDIEVKLRDMTKCFEQHIKQRNQDVDMVREVQKDMIDFKLYLDNFIHKRAEKSVRKMKV